MNEAPDARTEGISWRGRRKVADPKDVTISFRCTGASYAVIDEAATRVGLSIGGYLRTLALGSAGPRAVRRPPIERRELARLLGLLGNLTGNINQISKAYNISRRIPDAPEMIAIREHVAVMRAALLRALGYGDGDGDGDGD
jgi:hypothetical protein